MNRLTLIHRQMSWSLLSPLSSPISYIHVHKSTTIKSPPTKSGRFCQRNLQEILQAVVGRNGSFHRCVWFTCRFNSVACANIFLNSCWTFRTANLPCFVGHFQSLFGYRIELFTGHFTSKSDGFGNFADIGSVLTGLLSKEESHLGKFSWSPGGTREAL